MEKCCLCKVSVTSVQEKKRRKKLHGNACKETRDALNTELDDAFKMNLVDFKDTSSVNCYICKNCDTLLNNILELQKHLSRLKDTVKGYISSFQCNVASGNIIKRVSSTSSTAVPPPKRICLDSDRSPSTSPAITVRWYLIYLYTSISLI